MRPTRTQSIKLFLQATTHADLASLYNHDMEVQVNVAQDGGERISGDFKGKQWHGFTDGLQTWKPIRIPYNANSEPEYTDIEVSYDIAQHAEGIGMTGWDWKERVSRWVAFDFDAISGHSEKHARKMTEDELLQLQKAVQDIEWVTIRKSTGGRGLHIYVFLEPISTHNHNEHAALARAILAKMSAITGFDFKSKVDVVGGNMWVWHRKMKGTEGLQLLKQGTVLDNVPPDWKDHVKVIIGRRTKNLPQFIADQQSTIPEVEDKFLQLCGQRARIPLDEEHKRLIDWLTTRYPNCVSWNPDHWMLTTHTSLLAEAHNELPIKGPFATVATGREKGNDWNCYMYPMRKGAWAVRRFSPGCIEHSSWQQDGTGWTRSFFNRLPDFATACRMHGGIEDPSGGYWFENVEQAQKSALLFGVDLGVPASHPTHSHRKCKLKEHKSGRLQIEMKRESEDPMLPSWLEAKGKWQKLFDGKMSDSEEPEIAVCDDEVRHLITNTGEDYGWVINSDEDGWHTETFQHVKSYLQSRGYNPTEVQNILGSSIHRCWKLVNLPFQEEYPKDRQWNRGAAQFRYAPSINRDNLNYSTWLSVLNHCGSGLDLAIKEHPWAKTNGLLTGADYLKIWIASLFKHPTEPLPYLFFYGEQNSGKSIFHEALSILITENAVVRADTALISQSNFNGELENAILCVIEETDLRQNKTAYNRIKDWVTSLQLPIHKKGRQPYSIPNKTHYIQTANSHLFCPVFMGDTRITMAYVPLLEQDKLIPKKQLIQLLEKEAPDFMAELLNLEIPYCNDRLNIPVMTTEDKTAAEKANQTFLEMFIMEKTYPVDGELIIFSEFYDKFIEYLDPNYIKEWTKIKVGKEVPPNYPKGRLPQNGQMWFGNMSWKPKDEKTPAKPKLILKNGWLVSVVTEKEASSEIPNVSVQSN